MFSNFVTAAKGLFTRQESEDALNTPTTASANAPAMVAATRKGTVPSQKKENSKSNGMPQQGKRKAQPAPTEKTDDKQSKRRKRNARELENDSTDDSASEISNELSEDDKHADTKNHFRFGSEEPQLSNSATQPELASAQASRDDDDSDSDSDDDAPEAFDNATALLKIKEQAKKQEKAKQQYVQRPL